MTDGASLPEEIEGTIVFTKVDGYTDLKISSDNLKQEQDGVMLPRIDEFAPNEPVTREGFAYS
ncbi:hypothetical protein [Halobacillus karajensis]|uniref:hypothetical protein n=1 Tax=Halobacillus karajensis TaxID=195088 RepID=UPI000559850D|nr:hypothetical protein [Halobacillus karajensis]